ncbi:MAG: MoaD/ThiS family protein [Dehalococcoidia bacterium]
MAKLDIRFQGVFEGIAQRKNEVLELTSPSLATVVTALGRLYGRRFSHMVWDDSRMLRAGVSVLVNGQPRDREAPLQEGDEVLFLTPLGGFHG